MNFRKLANTDIKVSTICLGTMTWSKQNNQREAFKQMDYALDNGINFFDTAEIYPSPYFEKTYGNSEKIIGNWFKERKRRDKIILATKISGPGLSYIRGGGPQYTEKKISEAIENSLKRLKTDYIDLYQLHWPERKTNFFGRFNFKQQDDTFNFKGSWNKIETILKVLKNFVDQGKIRYIGLSNETPWGLSKFLELSTLHGLPRVVSVQNLYNLLNRTYEMGLAEISIREKIGLLAYSPLASGYLTANYKNNQLSNKSRMKQNLIRYKKPSALMAIKKYHEICNEFNLNFAQMAIKFCEIQKFLTSVIIGPINMEQLKISIRSVNVNLTDEILKKINDVQVKYPNIDEYYI